MRRFSGKCPPKGHLPALRKLHINPVIIDFSFKMDRNPEIRFSPERCRWWKRFVDNEIPPDLKFFLSEYKSHQNIWNSFPMISLFPYCFSL